MCALQIVARLGTEVSGSIHSIAVKEEWKRVLYTQNEGLQQQSFWDDKEATNRISLVGRSASSVGIH